MKTFIFSIPARLRSFNEKLDVKGALCGKSWEVFNDEGIKQLFIFNTDGTLLITTNGKVLMSSWQYIPANSSVIITAENETTMFHPAFYDKVIFALQQDGVERYLFMLDEQAKPLFTEMTLERLERFFEEQEQRIKQAELEKQLLAEVELKGRQREREEVLRIKEKEEISQFIITNKEQLNRSFRNRRLFASLASIIGLLLLSLFIISNAVLSNNYFDLAENTSFWIVCLIIGMSLLSIGLIILLQDTGVYLKVVIENKLGYNIVYHSTDEIKQLYEEL